MTSALRPLRPPAAALAVAASLALAACDAARSEGCPGHVIAALALHGDLDAAATGCVAPPAGGWTVPATLPEAPPDGTFDAEFTYDDATQQLAYCTGAPHAAALLGTRSGDHLHAEITLPGAVLGGCGATCTPLMTVVVDGDLSSTTSPATFSGTLTETFHDSTDSCAPCQLPCTSTYVLTGTEQ